MPNPTERVITVQRRLRLEERTCPVCGATFMCTWQQVYDTNRCEQRAAYQRNADKRRAARRERYQRQRQQATGGPTPAESRG